MASAGQLRLSMSIHSRPTTIKSMFWSCYFLEGLTPDPLKIQPVVFIYYTRVSPRRVVGPITGPKKAKFLEKSPKIRKNLPISKKRALPKKPRIISVITIDHLCATILSWYCDHAWINMAMRQGLF